MTIKLHIRATTAGIWARASCIEVFVTFHLSTPPYATEANEHGSWISMKKRVRKLI